MTGCPIDSIHLPPNGVLTLMGRSMFSPPHNNMPSSMAGCPIDSIYLPPNGVLTLMGRSMFSPPHNNMPSSMTGCPIDSIYSPPNGVLTLMGRSMFSPPHNNMPSSRAPMSSKNCFSMAKIVPIVTGELKQDNQILAGIEQQWQTHSSRKDLHVPTNFHFC